MLLVEYLKQQGFSFSHNPDETDIYVYKKETQVMSVQGLFEVIVIEIERHDFWIYEYQYWQHEGHKERIDWIKRFNGQIMPTELPFLKKLLKSLF